MLQQTFLPSIGVWLLTDLPLGTAEKAQTAPAAVADRTIALVTGGSRGIGAAIVRQLAASGMEVIFTYETARTRAHELAALLSESGGAVQAWQCDLASRRAGTALVERALAELGRVDVLVNNAGIVRDGLFVRMTDQDWDAVIAVDLTAAMETCRAVLRGMLRVRAGRIINVASISGVVGNPGQVNYSAAKAGVIGLTKALAREVGGRGITVNAVAPGFIDSDMTRGLPEKVVDGLVRQIPLGRFGTVDEVAAAVDFLASRAASYINGQVIHVDGGLAT